MKNLFNEELISSKKKELVQLVNDFELALSSCSKDIKESDTFKLVMLAKEMLEDSKDLLDFANLALKNDNCFNYDSDMSGIIERCREYNTKMENRLTSCSSLSVK